MSIAIFWLLPRSKFVAEYFKDSSFDREASRPAAQLVFGSLMLVELIDSTLAASTHDLYKAKTDRTVFPLAYDAAISPGPDFLGQ